MAQPKIRARYKVVGPQMVTREVTVYNFDKETGKNSAEVKSITEPMWMVYFPQGHSIRVNEKELRHHNLHLRPRLVDMNTGDVIDAGGDEFDLGQPILDRDLELSDSMPMGPITLSEEPGSKSSKKVTE